MAAAVLALGGVWFVQQRGKNVNTLPTKNNFVLHRETFVPQRHPVPKGRGTPATFVATKLTRARKEQAPPQQGGVADQEKRPAPGEHINKAISLAREGAYDKAIRAASRASRALPDVSKGLSLMIAYARQYSDHADQARLALNGSSEVDLGEPWGKAQFVEQNDASIIFFAGGRHERFTVERFNGLKGVRFRLTRDYLDRANIPANDLILGAHQFLMNVNEEGDIDAPGARDAAQRRFRKAFTSRDRVSIENGTLMMKALEFTTKN
ncbi:MAG: hypothetical protein ACKOE4_06975 [Candidatus Kapaibacterium sp.]